MKTSIFTFTSIFHCLLFAFCVSNSALLAEARKARKHGFKIVNKTDFPIQVSLNQVGPLYWGIVEPGKTWHRPTGAVWFTIKAETFIEGESKKIKNKDAIIPVAKLVAATLYTAFTAGTGAIAAAAAGGAGALSTSVAGVSGALIASGLPATSALAIGGALVGGGTGSAAYKVAEEALKKVFSEENVTARKVGCYARKCPTYVVTGAPRFVKMYDKDGNGKEVVIDRKKVANLVASPMKIRKVK